MASDEKQEAGKMTTMRLSTETLERLDFFRQRYGWTPGEVLVQLLDYHDRIKAAVADLGQGVVNTGDPVVFLRTEIDGNVHFLNSSQETKLLAFLIGELGEQVPDAFRDMSGYPDELEIVKG